MIINPTEWLSWPDENGNGLLQAWVVGKDVEYPIPIETHNVSVDDVKIGKDQDFEFIFECVQKPDVYKNEEEYKNAGKHHSMATESVIPAGLFSPSGDPDFVQNPSIILNGRIIEVCECPGSSGWGVDDVLFTLTCLGNDYDVVIYDDMAKGIEVHEGNIVSAVVWVQGWPKEDY